jgi:hypothetical protein
MKNNGNSCLKGRAYAVTNGRCKSGFRSVSERLCVPACPKGWADLGSACLKPKAHDLGDPFAWTEGDE